MLPSPISALSAKLSCRPALTSRSSPSPLAQERAISAINQRVPVSDQRDRAVAQGRCFPRIGRNTRLAINRIGDVSVGGPG
jgi:hypothetical protein